MTTPETPATCRKSSHSATAETCVEVVRHCADRMDVRDTTYRDAGT